MEFYGGKYVCSGAAYCSGLSEIYAVAKLYYRHSDLTSTVRGSTVTTMRCVVIFHSLFAANQTNG